MNFDQLLNRYLGARFTTEAQERNEELAHQDEDAEGAQAEVEAAPED